MKAVSIVGPEKLQFVELPEPHAGPGQVVIRVRNVGICGSDLHTFVAKHPDCKLPVIPGHEFAGEVVEAGEGATHKIGDRVVVEPIEVCGHCYYCKRGEYIRCLNLKWLGCQLSGAFTERIAVSDERVYGIPASMSWEEGAAVEPLAIAVHALRRGGVREGDRIAIVGGGTIGLNILAAAKAAGVSYAAVVEPVEWRQRVAKELGADLVVKPEDADRIVKDTEVGVDVSLEAVGKSETAALALSLTKKGGKTVVAGVFEVPQFQFNPMMLVNNEKELYGNLGYAWGDFPTAISLIASGKVPAKRLVSRVLPLDQAEEGFRLGLSRGEVIKVQLQP
ncbi:zinc-dependent alcohol dehydrogenase [Tardisphaera saccharovorans]